MHGDSRWRHHAALCDCMRPHVSKCAHARPHAQASRPSSCTRGCGWPANTAQATTLTTALTTRVAHTQVAESEINALVFDGGPVEWTKPVSHERLVRRVRTICSTPTYHACTAADVPEVVGQYASVNGTDGAPACADGAAGGCRTPLVAMMSDALDLCGLRRTARWMASVGMPTFVYSWQWRPRCPLLDAVVEGDWGAYHESELSYLFTPFEGRPSAYPPSSALASPTVVPYPSPTAPCADLGASRAASAGCRLCVLGGRSHARARMGVARRLHPEHRRARVLHPERGGRPLRPVARVRRAGLDDGPRQHVHAGGAARRTHP